jgi:hypothetical protein
MRWLALCAALCGCRHHRGDIAGTLITAAVIALEVTAAEQPPPPAYCDTESDDPPHVCPGTAPAPPER